MPDREKTERLKCNLEKNYFANLSAAMNFSDKMSLIKRSYSKKKEVGIELKWQKNRKIYLKKKKKKKEERR